jgi:large subunit ribosomal protein L29
MKSTKASDFRGMSVGDLEQLLLQKEAELYEMRKDLVFRKVTDIAGVKVRRHDIARIKTVITEKQKEVKA